LKLRQHAEFHCNAPHQSLFNRYSPDFRAFEGDFPCYRGALQTNSIASDSPQFVAPSGATRDTLEQVGPEH
jgi:hypothetical protein